MPTIISVHGTFAAGAEDGEQWWQRGSPFERHLQDCIEGETGALSLQRLRWPGLNSETSRQAAAQALLGRCRTLERTGERYVLIGHSHGGSVISNALLLAGEANESLPNMLRWITVGTPFIHLTKGRPSLRIFATVLPVVILLAALGVAVLSATTPGSMLNRELATLDPAFDPARQQLGSLPGQTVTIDREKLKRLLEASPYRPPPQLPNSLQPQTPPATLSDEVRERLNLPSNSPGFGLPAFGETRTREQEQEEINRRALDLLAQAEAQTAAAPATSGALAIIVSAYFFVVLGAAYLLLVRFTSSASVAIGPGQLRRVGKHFASRWLGFAHAVDEAVSGLRLAMSVGPFRHLLVPEITKRIRTASLWLLSALLILSIAVWVVLFSAASGLPLSNPVSYLLDFFSAFGKSPEQAVRIGIRVLVFVYLAGLAIVLGTALLMRLGLSWTGGRFDELFQSLVLGLNFPEQAATDVSSRPMWASRPPVALPPELTRELTNFDDSQSLTFVHNLRQELYAALQSPSPAILHNLATTRELLRNMMAGFELLHTNYFESPLFRKLMFAALARQPGLRATAGFAADPDYRRLTDWLERAPPLPTASDTGLPTATL
jgi:hypothetical protein